MLIPSEFARLAAVHGTVAAVCDPHEIANVLGVDGVEFMLENARSSPFGFCFGAPSCVPATPFETAGGSLGPAEIEYLVQKDEIKFLAEMMNFPGVINRDPAVMERIQIAKRYGKPVDGHAPGLRGEPLKLYIGAGITTDHETFTFEEGREKLSLGMKLLIRSGSAAQDFDALGPLVSLYPGQCMFCTDDLHPDHLVKGHINKIIKKGLGQGIDIFTLLRCACLNPAAHYGLDVGLLRRGDYADFLEVDGLESLNVLQTFIRGQCLAREGRPLAANVPLPPDGCPNRFGIGKKRPGDFSLKAGAGRVNVIEALDGMIVTGWAVEEPKIAGGNVVADAERDILKIAVVNRYSEAPPALGLIRGFGLKQGAMASSVAHDSHNIVAVGVGDAELCDAVNLVIENRGGLSAVGPGFSEVLPLPVAGIMTDEDGYLVAEKYSRMDAAAKRLGSKLRAPFMTLSFMALPVIPKLKMTDRGLFDAERFRFVDLHAG